MVRNQNTETEPLFYFPPNLSPLHHKGFIKKFVFTQYVHISTANFKPYGRSCWRERERKSDRKLSI